MAKAKKEIKHYAVNLTKNKVTLNEGKLIISSGLCVELTEAEIISVEVIDARRKGWISLQNHPLDKPLFDPVPSGRDLAVDGKRGIAAALGGTLIPPRRGTPTLPPTTTPIGSVPIEQEERRVAKVAAVEERPAVKVRKPRKRKEVESLVK